MKGQPNSDELYAIYRRDRGWTVRFVRSGKRHEKNFADSMFGGPDPALESAQAWRDGMLALHPPGPRRERAQKARRAQPAVAGVTAELGPSGQIRLWRAKTYVAAGRVLQKTFSVGRYGASAETLAHAERQRQLRLLTGLCRVHPSEEALRSRAQRKKLRPAPPVPALAVADVVRSTNTSGYPGVVLRSRAGRSYWTAQSTQGGKWTSRSFSIERHGNEVALLLALMARQEQRAAFEQSSTAGTSRRRRQ